MLVRAAADVGMPLRHGTGGPHRDKQDEYLVWVYDSNQFPFFKGEEYHQFHPNTVLGRWVPQSYTGKLKEVQKAEGRLKLEGCASSEGSSILLSLTPVVIGVLGVGGLTCAAMASRELCKNSRAGSEVSCASSTSVQC